ncbi:MAG: hypothetical protein ACOCT9_00300, partial [archaeon]
MKKDKFIDGFMKIAEVIKDEDAIQRLKTNDFKINEVSEDLGFVVDQKEKTAEYKLPNETQNWNKEIIKRLYNEHDWLDVNNFYLRWKSEFDGEKGYGLGVIVLQNEDKAISVPVIVKNYKLQPFDLFFDLEDEQLYPLTKQNVENSFYDTGIAEKLVDKKKKNRSPISDVFPPRMGKYVFASSDINLIDNIEIAEDEMADFNAQIKDKTVLANAQDNDAFIKLSNKVLNKKPFEQSNIFKEKTKISAIIVKPEEKQGYKLNWFEDDNFISKTASYYEAYQLIKEALDLNKEEIDQKLKEVDEGKNIAYYNDDLFKSKSFTDKDIDKIDIKEITSGKRILTQTKNGKEIEGFAIPKTYSLQTGKITDDALLIDDERNIITYSPKIIGKEKPGDKQLKDVLVRKIIQFPAKDTVVSFAWRDNEYNDFVAIQPGKILEYEEIEDTGKLFTLLTTFGSMHKVLIMDDVIKPNFTKNNKYNAIIIPENASMLIAKDKNKQLVENVREFKRNLIKEANV